MKHFQRLALIILLLLNFGGCGLIPTEREDAASSTTSPLSGVTAIAAGDLHTCALMSDRSVKCWGSNLEGQLGDGTIISKSYPAKVSGINTATQLAASYHTCAILSDNTTQCWGRGDSGQLGDNNSTGSRTSVVVSGLGSAKSIDASPRSSCATLIDNTTKCWGDYYISNQNSPNTIVGITNTHTVATGYGHACVLLNDQTIQCWGDGGRGQLGNGSSSSNSNPVTVSSISTATAIAVGGNQAGHSCALLSDNTIQCWGANDYGQLGDGTQTDRSTPTAVSSISTAIAVAVGGGGEGCGGVGCYNSGHSCAVLSNNTIQCWGANDYGQLGNGTTDNSSLPVTVPGISNATEVTAGFQHTCALLSDSTVKCWGYNNQGQLGDGTKQSKLTPKMVLN
jgi:alpha-tubulin suppressor-like RCC1 family protein